MCFGKQILNISVILDCDDWLVGACFAEEREGRRRVCWSGWEHA